MDDMAEAEYLEHIGIQRRSGRYPWGSGENPYQRSKSFKSYVAELESKGLTDTQIAEYIEAYAKQYDPHAHFSTTDLRAATAISTEQIHSENVARARYLKDERKMSNVAIAEQMGTRESTVRGWLKAGDTIKENSLRATAEKLKEELETKEFLDVGTGNQLWMGISETKLRTAVAMLRDEGYEVWSIKNPQLGTDKMTTYKVLAKPGTSWHDARAAVVRGDLRIIGAQSDDGGLTYRDPKALPVSVNSKRIQINYADDGGATKDGVIEIRRGVEDLSLGGKRYAQVRVAVDGTHYLKGMAMYADDLPAGVDIRFNTNKTKAEVAGKEPLAALKPLKQTKEGAVDPANPFGASTRPRLYIDKDGKEKTSPLNIVNEEGDWDKWSRNLSSQMLSKQPLTLASAQLGKARAAKQQDLDTIMALTNPVVKKKLLLEYADSADAAAVHLKAAKMDRQSTHVILPMNSMRRDEIFAPNFENGEKVTLVRHPHGGPFEIPELTVNNNNRTAKRIMGGARDAVGIHHSVAAQLSGADFDGDTVLVIPNDSRKIKNRPPLEGLKDFEPKTAYKIPDDDKVTPRMTKKNTQTEMGRISNLITDMTIHKANDEELTRAIRHSMVVIDAEKHGLDYKRSEKDHRIAELKKTYQAPHKGASTLISRASSDAKVPQRRYISGNKGINPKTGERVYEETGRTYVNKKGQVVEKTTKGTKMEFAKVDSKGVLRGPDGKPMSSGTPMEEVYASHAISMKSLANQARKESVALQMPRQSAAAKAIYAKEVQSLDTKLKTALRNAPLERRAQVLGNAMAKARVEDDPTLDKDDVKKIKYQSLEEARNITGASKIKVHIEDREWEAIQAGAISHTKLSDILTNADMERVKELATPKPRTSLTPGQMARARQMQMSGRSMSEIARELGIPRSTLSNNLA